MSQSAYTFMNFAGPWNFSQVTDAKVYYQLRGLYFYWDKIAILWMFTVYFHFFEYAHILVELYLHFKRQKIF